MRTHGVEPQIRYSVGDHATQLALVASGLTAALIPDAVRQQVPPGVLCVPTDPPLRRHMQAVWRPRTETPPVRAGLDVLTHASRSEESATLLKAASEENHTDGRDVG